MIDRTGQAKTQPWLFIGRCMVPKFVLLENYYSILKMYRVRVKRMCKTIKLVQIVPMHAPLYNGHLFMHIKIVCLSLVSAENSQSIYCIFSSSFVCYFVLLVQNKRYFVYVVFFSVLTQRYFARSFECIF